VQRGDTLYAIAFANGLDHREIAIWNQLESADRILVGQVLRLAPPPGGVEVKPLDDEPAPSARPLAGPPCCANRKRYCWRIPRPTGRRWRAPAWRRWLCPCVKQAPVAAMSPAPGNRCKCSGR
jgi:lipoprotein NlpD